MEQEKYIWHKAVNEAVKVMPLNLMGAFMGAVVGTTTGLTGSLAAVYVASAVGAFVGAKYLSPILREEPKNNWSSYNSSDLRYIYEENGRTLASGASTAIIMTAMTLMKPYITL